MTGRASLLMAGAALVTVVVGIGDVVSLIAQENKKAILLNPAAMTEQAPAQYKINFDTSAGTFVIQMNREWAPNGVDRMFNLVKNGYYDGVRFYRVVPDFLVQFGIHGDPEVWAKWRVWRMVDDLPAIKTGRPIKKGTFAYISSGVNRKNPIVFINLDDKDDGRMGPEVSPLGEVVSGMNVVERLYAGYGDTPPNGKGPEINGLNFEGNKYLEANFPRLDYIKAATITQ
jgi:peptidyl-prolyl cis-trans isomerase A (cyclophilin A)